MTNYFGLVGRIVNIDNHKKYIIVTLNIWRDYKEENGDYIYDNIKVMIKNKIKDSVVEYCKLGDVIGVSGTIQEYKKQYNFLVRKVSFISAKKND